MVDPSAAHVETTASLLATLEALHPLPAAEQAKVRALCRRRMLGPGEHFVGAGERTREVAFLERGLLRYFYLGPDGAQFTRFFCSGGGFVTSYTALLTGAPSAYAIQALEASVLLVFPFSGWLQLLEGHPAWGAINRALLDRALLEAEERERSLILDDARTRYQRFLDANPGLEARVRQYDIASYLGITPVALSRLRGRLRRSRRAGGPAATT
jgi:CRP-like cAMP-binding protein